MDSLKYWNTKDFEISSYKYSLKDRVNKTYGVSGSDTTGLCTYTYNELGFRGDPPFKEGFRVMSIGDSMTEGVGVSNNHTWSSNFCNNIGNTVDLNFGCGGRSNDYIVRCLLSYYDLIKPDLVLIMYTSPQRREIYTKDNSIEPFIPTDSWGYLEKTEEGREIQNHLVSLQNDNADFINWYKNHLLIKYFLESKKCNWLWNGWMGIPSNIDEFNRFDGEYGQFIDKGVDGAHPGPLNNKKYAKSLHHYILSNFPNYIPNNGIIPSKLI
jgi:lysophospholipase L1-like esterase